jgi:hypothetical protein
MSARSRQLKSGSIIFNGNKSVFSCTVRNVSKGGLCLLVPSGLTVPMAFDLSSDGERRHCAVVWRLLDRIGVKYHQTARVTEMRKQRREPAPGPL